MKTYRIYFWKTPCEIYPLISHKGVPISNVIFFSVLTKRKFAYDVSLDYVLIFGMLDTYHINIPFNLLWSHNVAHNCDHATFNVDCCYDILQYLLRICMSIKASVKFQAYHHSTTSTCRNILQSLTYKQNVSCL
jgi:hypothetical protein